MSKKVGQTPGGQDGEQGDRVNPFEKCKLDNLQNSFWSPGVFQNVNMGETPPQNGWTIDQLAVLFPKPIEDSPSSHRNEYPVDSAMEAKAQADIDKFFSSGLIAPSPEHVGKEKDGSLDQTTDESNSGCITQSNALTTTQLSLPSILPPLLEAALAPFMQSGFSSGFEPFTAPSKEINQNSSKSCNSGSENNSFSVVRRRLELSFGETIPQEDPSPLSNATLPYGDPFGRNHEVISPLAYSSSVLSPPQASLRDLKAKFQRCEFTPEVNEVFMGSPEITPIQGDDVFAAEIAQASTPKTSLASMSYHRVEQQVNSTTPTGQRTFVQRSRFRRRKIAGIINPDKDDLTTSIGEPGDFQSSKKTKLDAEAPNAIINGPRALYIKIVLENVFHRLNLASLKECRLVCKTWHEASSVSFRKKSFCVPMKYEYNGNESSEEMTGLLENSVSIFDSFFLGNFPFGLPFENLSISEQIHDSQVTKGIIGEAALRNCLLDWGKDLKGIRLTLEKQTANKTVSLSEILTELCHDMEELQLFKGENIAFQKLNLKERQVSNIKRIIFGEDLRLYIPTDTKEEVNEMSEVAELFKATANVEFVEVFTNNLNLSYSIASSLVKYAKKLTTLCWYNVLPNRDLQLLAKAPDNMNLKTLRLHCTLFPHETTSQDLFDFLSRSKNTLETLYLSGNIFESYDVVSASDEEDIGDQPVERLRFVDFLEFEFPEMQNLTVLELKNIFHFRVNTLDFVLKFPNLQKLILHNISYASCVHPFRPDELFQRLLNPLMELVRNPHQILRELELHGEIMSRDFISLLSRCFPNLKVANLFVNSADSFLTVLSKFKTLEELELRFIPTSFVTCNAALTAFLPNMLGLKKLKLSSVGPHPFWLTKHLVEGSFERMTNMHQLKFVNCSILQGDYEEILQSLKCCGLVVFKDCVVQTLVSLNASYINGTVI